ncbi:MAG TPA: DUF6531 domain-containing protein, partial [Polyangiaceae bacterium]|nr:DUF6531 domain-containing protein [Polyangiaceae bacterium]
MTLGFKRLGLGIACVGAAVLLGSFVAKPARAQSSDPPGTACVWDVNTASWVYPSGAACVTVGAFSSSGYYGYVATRGLVLRADGTPIWAEYPPDQQAPTGAKDASGQELTSIVPGVPHELQDAVGSYKDAQVLSLDEVLFVLDSFNQLDKQYGTSSPKRYELLPKDQLHTRKDLNNAPVPLPPFGARTTQVMVLRESETPPGTNPVLAEFPMDPRQDPANAPCTRPLTAEPFGGRKNFLIKTNNASDGPPVGSILTSSPYVISYLADFFSQVDKGTPTTWGACRDMPTDGLNSPNADDVRRFEDCDAWRVGKVWGPIIGATVDSGSRWMFQSNQGALTQPGTGRFDLEYPYIQDSQFWDTLFVSMTFAPFDARIPFGSRFLTRRRVQGGATFEVNPGAVSAFGTAFTGLGYGNILGGQSPTAMAQWGGGLMDTHKWRSVNVGIEVTYMAGRVSMRNDQRPGIPLAGQGPDAVDAQVPVHIDDPGGLITAEEDDKTTYAHIHGPQPVRSLVDLDGNLATGGEGSTITRVAVANGTGGTVSAEQTPAGRLSPDGTPSPVYDSDLLFDISRADFANTDVHVFGPAGDLITTRIGLRPNESPGLDCSNTPCQVKDPDPVAGAVIQDFMRNRYPGARYRVVIINRSTGYMGTGYVSVNSTNTDVTTSALGGFKIVAADGKDDIVLRPPNLTVEVRRAPKRTSPDDDVCTQLKGSEACEHLIGFEGGGLTDDTQIVITTTWLDWDGSPLPSGLPGFTGRLSKVIDSDKLGGVTVSTTDASKADLSAEGASPVGHFQIEPGRRTQVVRLADASSAAHYYLHVSGANFGRCGGSQTNGGDQHDPSEWFTSNSPACASFAQQINAQFDLHDDRRPDLYVPIRVPVFDAARTADVLSLRLHDAQQATGNGPLPPELQHIKVDPVYQNVYRAEEQFTVYELPELQPLQVVTQYDPTKKQTNTTLNFGYDLGAGSFDPLTPYGSAKDPIWSLGFEELQALVDQHNASNCPPATACAEFVNIDALLALSPAEQLAAIGELVGELTPEDYLSLQLYLGNDRGNPLYQDFDVPILLEMDAAPIVLTRRENLGAFKAEATLPAVLDDYQAIKFGVLRDSFITVNAVSDDGKDVVPLVLPTKTPTPKGAHYFVLDGSKLTAPAIGSAFTLQFVARLPPNPDQPPSQSPSHTVNIAVRRDVERDNRPLGEVVEHDVNILDGSLRLSRQDFSLPGLGPELSFQRSYTNLHGEEPIRPDQESDLGPGWSHTLKSELKGFVLGPIGAGSVPGWVSAASSHIADPSEVEPSLFEDAQQINVVQVNGAMFMKVNGAWVGEQGRQAKLLEDPNCGPFAPTDCFHYVARDGTTYAFDYPKSTDPVAPTPGSSQTFVGVDGGLAERLGVHTDLTASLGQSGRPGGPVPSVRANWIEDRFGNRLVFHYDSQGRVQSVVDATTRSCALAYDFDEAQDCPHPAKGFQRLRSVTCLQDPDTKEPVRNVFGDDISIRVEFCYDDTGNLEQVSRGNELEHYEYEREGGLTGGSFNLKSIADARGSTRTFHYRTGHGLVTSGLNSSQFFQKEDMVASIDFPPTMGVDGVLNPSVSFRYGSDCNGDECTPDDTRTVTDPRGRGLKKLYHLNQQGSPVRIDEPRGKYTELVWSEDDPNAGCDSGAPLFGHVLLKRTVFRGDKTIVTRFGYDSEGNVTSECGPARYTQTWANFGLLATHTDFHNIEQTWTYDDKGFLKVHVVDAGHDEFKTEYEQDLHHPGRVLTETIKAAAGDRVARHSYDRHGNAASTSIDGVAHSTVTVQYDARGRQELAYDRKLAVTKYHYNTNDHLERVELPKDVDTDGVEHVATELHNTYDSAGNLLTETDRNGLLLTYTYTPQNQVDSITRDADVEGPVTRQLTYDELGNVASEEDWAKSVITHSYDDL